MSGVHSEIKKHCRDMMDVEAEDKQGLTSMIDCLLKSKKVGIERGSNDMVSVQKGTGMGLVCSGELSNPTFHQLVERHWACMPEVQRRCGIR